MSKLDLDKPVQTRGGEQARLICRNATADPYTLVALVKDRDGREYPRIFTSEGHYNKSNADTSMDLINIPEPATEYLFVGGAADGERIRCDHWPLASVTHNGDPYELRWIHADRCFYALQSLDQLQILDALTKNYRAAARSNLFSLPCRDVIAPGTEGTDGSDGVRGTTSVQDIFLVWTYYSGQPATLRAVHTTRRAADDAAQNWAMILSPGQGAYVSIQSLYE